MFMHIIEHFTKLVYNCQSDMERPKPAKGDSYVCPGTARCGQICRGLGRQGWKTAANLGEPGKCQTPQYLTLDGNGKSQILGLDGELPDRLAQGLADYLREYHAEEGPERSARLEIKNGFQAVQAARNELYQNMLAAIKDGGLAPEEIKFYQDQIEKAKQNLQEVTGKYELEDAMLGRAAFDRQCLDEYGVIFTDDMLAHVERLVNNAATGRPSMLQGDKGIAKTQVVKYISRLIAPNKPPLIDSIHGDTMAHTFTGKQTQDEATGRVVWQDSKLAVAAREGRPVLLDEANFGDPSVLAALHDVLLLKPGNKLPTENGDIEIQPGFMVCMTANEGDRYQNRVDLDAAFKDRLDVISFMYPDQSKRPHTDNMPETIRLAFAAAVDNEGTLSANVAIKDLMDLARMAHVSQQLYTQRAQNVRTILSGINLPNNNTVSSMLDDRPVMTNCISPRDMISAILLAARGNLINITIKTELEALLRKLDKDGDDYNRRILTALYGKKS